MKKQKYYINLTDQERSEILSSLLIIVAQKHTLLIGRHLASLKKRLFLKLFSEN